jgi:MFS family permease
MQSNRLIALSADPTGRKAWWRTFNGEQWIIFAVALLAWALDCFDQQIFNLARDGAIEHLLGRQSAIEYAPYTTSFFLIGWAIGGLILGPLGDRYGRARMLMVAVLMYALSTGMNASFWSFCAYRFITGLGVGGVFGLAVALVSDSLPDAARAPAIGMMQSLSAFGNMTAGLTGMGIGLLAHRNLLPFNLQTWQWLFIVGAFPAMMLLPLFFWIREPQRWTEARAAGLRSGIRFGSYSYLLTDPTWRRHAWLGLLMCGAGIVGLWGIGNFYPRIIGSIIDVHLASSSLSPDAIANERTYWSSVGSLLQNAGGLVGMWSLAKLSQVQGRRLACGAAVTLSFLSTLLALIYLRHVSQIYWILPIMGFGQYSVFGAYAIYLPELFPTSLRSTGVSFCYNLARLLAATAPFTLGQLTHRLGGDVEAFRTAGIAVSFSLLIGLLVLPFLPETRGKPLPADSEALTK